MQYTVAVRASTKVGYGFLGDPMTVTTNESVPGALKIEGSVTADLSSISLKWSAPTPANGKLKDYEVCSRSGGGSPMCINIADRQYRIPNLNPGTMYNISVSASTMIGKGPIVSVLKKTDESGYIEGKFNWGKVNTKESAEIGSAWTTIANELNAVQEIRFCVTQKAVRDRMKLLVERHKKKTREEESPSGISPEQSDIYEALDTIIELIDDAEQHFEKDPYEKQQKIENNRKQAEELRVKAMESYGESRKRQLESGESEPKPRRKRATGGETLVYLQEKSEKEFELRKAELEIKKKKEVKNKREVEMTLQK
ncbi:nucleoporin GLE1-like [Paramuricea clavata]|uniref:Nucleoporin GLE1-like n=1 Tax=Paramuricea clavata TaxID=317549 RepID=A0A7D9E6A8_PARCT|nr:nucleoporin GLE1-like [Paramuricea clavata]